MLGNWPPGVRESRVIMAAQTAEGMNLLKEEFKEFFILLSVLCTVRRSLNHLLLMHQSI